VKYTMVGCNERVKIGSTTLCESIMTSIKKRKVVLSHAASILHYLQAFEDTDGRPHDVPASS
jgi:hypothetical protein